MAELTVTSLYFEDQELARLPCPGGILRIVRGFGSGLSRSADGRIWAVGDRGPNMSMELAIERYGLAHLKNLDVGPGAKVMPCLEIGPALAELQVDGDCVRVLRVVALSDTRGAPLSGLPPPVGDHCLVEPALSMDGNLYPPDPGGADTEGIVALEDGTFWVGDEYSPSLLRVAADGTVLTRWVPAGSEDAFAEAPYPIVGALPALAVKRKLNRGFEAIGISPDQSTLYLAFQSPLAHPDEQAHRTGRWVRIWKLDAADGRLLAQFAYPLDNPSSFLRDRQAGEFDWADIKVSELTVLGSDRLLMLERGSHSTKLYRVELSTDLRLPPEHGRLETRPTLEELSGHGADLPLLRKDLLLTTDEHEEVGPDLEGMIVLGPNSLLLVNDNDFGVDGIGTRFWRVDIAGPLLFGVADSGETAEMRASGPMAEW